MLRTGLFQISEIFKFCNICKNSVGWKLLIWTSEVFQNPKLFEESQQSSQRSRTLNIWESVLSHQAMPNLYRKPCVQFAIWTPVWADGPHPTPGGAALCAWTFHNCLQEHKDVITQGYTHAHTCLWLQGKQISSIILILHLEKNHQYGLGSTPDWSVKVFASRLRMVLVLPQS